MLNIIRNDITKVRADAIVNTANPKPVYADGTDYAVYTAAGPDLLLAERRKIGDIAPGQAEVTPAFNLDAKYIIHTVGPVWEGGNSGEFEVLENCYRNSLAKAASLKCESIAFPLISTGTYGFPKDKALKIAVDTISYFLKDNEMDITLVVFDRTAFKLSEELTKSIDSYLANNLSVPQFIDDDYAAEKKSINSPFRNRRRRDGALYDIMPSANIPANTADEEHEPLLSFSIMPDAAKTAAEKPAADIEEYLRESSPGFAEHLLHLIDKKGFTDPQVYKKANLDRKLFSKIKCTPDYTPKRKTIIALALALELNLDETLDLLKSAGYTLSQGSRFDLIIRYCVEQGKYNVIEVNTILFEYCHDTLS